ncbi:LysR family transcriptional regulator [Goekera deserti]|uniref:LysR family transcriptional regulator n=1 Tax=Goekera deserti TaxID=2497753 RepID=A0A7K3WDN6_9ACTN|nr:LysR family transcriptional regulator [Goekera deserti]NDI48131.1 LysR family transcriptional regulator [Goekera deserti]NEL53880.1 LysR family transcriptional regulator [Goekera deserti]
MSLPNLKILRTFLEVASQGSMTDAATALGYVPSAVSSHVADLERELRVRLIDRSPGSRLVLTAAGRAVQAAAAELLVSTTSFQDAVGELADGHVEELRLGSFPSALAHLVAPALSGVADGVRLHIVEVETPAGLRMVKSGEIDALVAYRYLPDDEPYARDGFQVSQLGHDALTLVASSDRDWDFAACVDARWVAGHAGNGDRRLLERWARSLRFKPTIRYEVEEFQSSLALIQTGCAVGLLPTHVAAPSIDRGLIRPVALPDDLSCPPREILGVTRTVHRPRVVLRLFDELTVRLGG